MAGPSSRDRMIEFAGNGRLPLDDEHPVWADCRSKIEAAAVGEVIAMAQRAATPDPPTTGPGDKAPPPAVPPTAERVQAAVAATPGAAAAPLAAALGTTAKAMAPVMAVLVKAGAVRTTGARRAKRYFVAEPAVHAPAPVEAERQPALPLGADCPAETDEEDATEEGGESESMPSAERRRSQEPRA